MQGSLEAPVTGENYHLPDTGAPATWQKYIYIFGGRLSKESDFRWLLEIFLRPIKFSGKPCHDDQHPIQGGFNTPNQFLSRKPDLSLCLFGLQ